jgi:branched-chain amino acid transport system substrate-binding protein
LKLLSIASVFLGSTITAHAADIVVGFATASSGFMQAYDRPAQDAAMMRIDDQQDRRPTRT